MLKILKKKLEFGKAKTAELAYGMCWHIGNPAHDGEGVAKFLEHVRRRPWWDGGDTVEAIGPSDKRFQASEHKDAMLDSMSEASGLIKKRGSTCWGKICGNHEYGGSGPIGDIAAKIALDAGVEYLGACCYFDIGMPKGRSLLFAAHGSGSMGFNSGVPERDDVNRRLKLRRGLSGFDADVKCVGHYHRTIIDPARNKYVGTVDDGRFARRPTALRNSWVMAAPSMFANYAEGGGVNYAEMKLYPPTDIGWLGIVFNRDATVACVREYTHKGKVSREVIREDLR